ncbi:redox-sensitive transcriptional activator SoxR [Hyphomonas jannaschiana]|uniref:Redox-sensitive transcriptional activator SoxR n=1 Tax=Hyphomonas jannaschiana VP2 TaxID=1280952 RepID=A0A059FC25_9PROT|nr:redox-sensitive transcriptional activator SoxR [Hyphomonas jannaschiana]KCZ88091.1 redox-sensitive transcriptional activator SoxR [Hyphomonas jannaschiana VP2]
MKQGLSIGDVARRTGLSVSAIRFYESRGLVKPDRRPSGQREFARADIRRLSFILIAQQMGLTIEEISEVLSDLPDNRTPTKADWTRISQHFRKRLDDHIAMVERLRNRLDGCIGCGCLSLKTCKLYNPDDRARAAGPGPRFVMTGESVSPQA